MRTDQLPLPDLVRLARTTNNLSQAAFGMLLGKSQSEISRYENGVTEPPGGLVQHCMHILHTEYMSESDDSITATELSELIMKSLTDDRYAGLRYALSRLISTCIRSSEVSGTPE